MLGHVLSDARSVSMDVITIMREIFMVFRTDKSYYDILGVDAFATANKIKYAFHQLAKKTHPDKQPGSDGADFKDIHEAYEILSDETKRAEYNRFLIGGHQDLLGNSPGFPQRQQNHPTRDQRFFTMFSDVFTYQEKGSQSKEEEAANERMSFLNLNKSQSTELWEMHQAFLGDSAYFQKNKYASKTLENLLYLFCDIDLSHLDEECRCDPKVVDMSFSHSLKSLRYASKDVIMELLDSKGSMLYERLTYLEFHHEKASEFLYHYVYDVDVTLFIKLMQINPNLITSFLAHEKILAFLRDPHCREHKEQIPVKQLYQAANNFIQMTDIDAVVRTDIDILYEIYQHYDRNVLREFDSCDDYAENYHALKQLVRKLFITYPEKIDLKDIISIQGLLDQESICFNYDIADETLTCKGKLTNDGSMQEHKFSSTHKIMAQNDAWHHLTFIHELAAHLEPRIFCKMLLSMPLEKRTEYLFASHESKYGSAYSVYKDRLDRFHSGYDQDNKIIKAQHLHALEALIYPVQTISQGELTRVKQQVCTFLQLYTAGWKMPIFGHHYQARVEHVINTINKSNTLFQVCLIIENQLSLLEGKAAEPLFQAKNEEFTLKKIFSSHATDRKEQHRWYNSAPKHLPAPTNLMESGYYRALMSAKDVIAKYNEQEIDASARFIY